ncbi:uncharacterized protein I206_106346 [Kwoniella pini CBS 10737]|uniref:Uncharacterized protein n=1 Tax=Kwoniella pini CBS 10737 TaxID=1296096 RepID=A0A1B9HU20_9TREE|nr:uncharacterized protein I206_07148 [Kwoniella pini CBS 10737]OCF46761.1 hypothetical protein I206_07148 [Kwoniella pini CBS 10737]
MRSQSSRSALLLDGAVLVFLRSEAEGTEPRSSIAQSSAYWDGQLSANATLLAAADRNVEYISGQPDMISNGFLAVALAVQKKYLKKRTRLRACKALNDADYSEPEVTWFMRSMFLAKEMRTTFDPSFHRRLFGQSVDENIETMATDYLKKYVPDHASDHTPIPDRNDTDTWNAPYRDILDEFETQRDCRNKFSSMASVIAGPSNSG